MKRTTINEALRLIRIYSKFSQVQLADRLGVAQSLVSDVESGRKGVSMDLLERYSDALGVRMSKLLFFAEEIEGQPIGRRGKLIIAEGILKLLEHLAPREHVPS